MDFKKIIKEFIRSDRSDKSYVYNESSFQFELTNFLRDKLDKKKVRIEKNIEDLEDHNFNKKYFQKRDIDIYIKNRKETAIELKFPRNGQIPEQMFQFVKDIKFLEELKKKGFGDNLFVALADNHLFWGGHKINEGIYKYFRGENTLEGEIQKPTGDKDREVKLKNTYKENDWDGVEDYTDKDTKHFEKFMIIEV